MRSHLHKLTALLLAVLLLAGCGKAPETTASEEEADVTGRYYLVESNGKVLPSLNEHAYLRLKDDGKAVYELTYDQLEYKWKLKDDGTLTLSMNSEKIKGELADGIIRICLDSTDRVFVQGKSAARKYIEENADRASASTAAPTDAPQPADASSAPSDRPFDPDVRFTAKDQNGNTVDETVFREHVLTMINFWEPWCGPCVGEMPELEQLYQDRGGELLILGVYWTEENAMATLAETGVTYPVILYDEVFEHWQSGYVPTTIFVDPAGHVIGH